MADFIAIIGSIISGFGAIFSLYTVFRLKKKMHVLESSLSSKGGELPPSPIVEDPIGKDISARMHDDDEGDD